MLSNSLDSTIDYFRVFNSTGFFILVLICFALIYLLGKKNLALQLMNFGSILLAVSLLIYFFSLFYEFYREWSSGDRNAQFAEINMIIGPYAWIYWLSMILRIAPSQLLWFSNPRRNIWVLLVIVFFTTFNFNIAFLIGLSYHNQDFIPPSRILYLPIKNFIPIHSFALTVYLLLVYGFAALINKFKHGSWQIYKNGSRII
jgi:hypothetical protein